MKVDEEKDYSEMNEYIKSYFYDNLPDDKAKIIVDHMYKRYGDQVGKSFIDHRLIPWFMDDYFWVRNNGTRWFAAVGDGGTGKSTLFQNMFYFFDQEFNLENGLSFGIYDFLDKLGSLPQLKSGRSLYMDEPDDDIHPATPMGKNLRKVLGKARQGCYFLGICATDLTDIPNYIWKKISVIFFTPKLGEVMVFRNRPDIGTYPLQEIRTSYSRKGYKIFFELKKEAEIYRTFNRLPFSRNEVRRYLSAKSRDFRDDLVTAKTLANVMNGEELDPIVAVVLKLTSNGLSMGDISKYLGVPKSTVGKYVLKHKHLLEAAKTLKIKELIKNGGGTV